MVRGRLFWKLFLGFTVVNLLAVAALVFMAWRWQAEQARELIEQRLDAAALSLAELATQWSIAPSDTVAKEVLDRAASVGVEVAIRNSEGASLESQPGANVLASPNAIVARQELVSDGQTRGELRVGLPGPQQGAALKSLARQYAGYLLLAALAMAAVGYGIASHLVGPIRSLDEAARAMASGDYGQRAFVANRDELGALARSFNQMGEVIGRQLSDLRESDRRQATVLGGMIEGVIAIDREQQVLFANAAAGKLFGFFPAQLEGRPLLEAVRNHHLHKATLSALESGAPQRLEVDWDERVLSVQVTPLPGEPSSGAVIVLHDTTELRRLESLRRDFVANVSHELKTPLSSIRANAETLLRGAVDDHDNRERFLEGICAQSDRLESLIHDMLNLARIESAQQPFEIQTLGVESAVSACLQNYEQRAAKNGVELTIDPATDPDLRDAAVRADPEGLRVILSNLVDNALKFTPAGGRVAVGWDADPNPGPMVRIEVSDTGVGIPEEKLSRVFERFFRVDEARTSHLGGTGLGLSIVKHLAMSFGGDVAVQSEPDRGATFSVTLPRG